MLFLAIFLGGGLGSLARYGVSSITSADFPYGTLVANVLACITLGTFLTYFSSKVDSSQFLNYFIAIGFCGGFSTFSTFSFETFELLKNGSYLVATLNIIVNIFFCLFVFYLFRNSLFPSA